MSVNAARRRKEMRTAETGETGERKDSSYTTVVALYRSLAFLPRGGVRELKFVVQTQTSFKSRRDLYFHSIRASSSSVCCAIYYCCNLLCKLCKVMPLF